MEKTRAGKYGRNLAIWIDYTIKELPKKQKEDYLTKFLTELETYSFIPRKSGQPPNEGCVHELSDLVEVEINKPEHLAMLVKEGIHLMYQKQTSARVLEALKKYLYSKI